VDPLGPFDATIDADLATGVAAALSAPVVPPMLLAVRLWEAQERARDAVVPAAVQRAAAGGVHGEHDVVVHRAPALGEPLRTWVELHGVRPAGRHAAVVVRYSTVDADDAVVAEHWWTTVYLGASCEPTGAAAPDHAMADDRRRLGRRSFEVDDDMARRYAEVSGDWSAHHFDAEAARASGADRPFLHGLATMALCAAGVVELAGARADRVRRVAVRFAAPMPLGGRLDVQVHDGLAFEATSNGTTVATNGLVELV
jgi:acyl dehydratase